VARVPAWATSQQIPVDKGRYRGRFGAQWASTQVPCYVARPVGGPDRRGTPNRFYRFGSEYVEAALAAQGRELVVVDSAEVDDDLVCDMTEILTSMCARRYGKRAAANRAQRAVAAAADPGEREAA
jgi:hypothetical protein